MNPTLISLLDLLRMAIIRCGGILQSPQWDSSGSCLIQVSPGPVPFPVQDPSVIRFLLLMQKEGVDLRFHLEPQEDRSQRLIMRLSKEQAQVEVPVARTELAAGSLGEPPLVVGLNLRGILMGLSRALTDLRTPATVRPQPLQVGQAQGWPLRQLPAI